MNLGKCEYRKQNLGDALQFKKVKKNSNGGFEKFREPALYLESLIANIEG